MSSFNFVSKAYFNTLFIIPPINHLFFITVSFIGGICSQFHAFSIFAILTCFITYAVLGFFLLGKNNPFLYFLMPIFFALGFFLCENQQAKVTDFSHETAGKILDIRATIANIEKIQNPRHKYLITLDLSHIKDSTNQPAFYSKTSAQIFLYAHTIYNFKDLLVGDCIEISCVPFKKIKNGDFATYLAKEKTTATIFMDKVTIKILSRPHYSISRELFLFRKKIFEELKTKIHPNTFQLFSSIFFGNRTSVKNQMQKTKEPFKTWGISHYLARSGLHLVVFVMIWQFFLNFVPVAHLFKQLFLIFLVLLYALLSWQSVSFERALIIFFIYKMCLLNKTPTNYVHLVIIVTFIVLLINPLQLFFLDFQLSFGLTLALAWFNQIEAHKKKLIS